jgi:oligopeptide/dipeptide ABC transporter ATP-binding protein
MPSPTLQVSNLSVAFIHEGQVIRPVRCVSFDVNAGERVALVGESGCGKSLTALSLVRLSPTDHARLSGSILFNGEELLGKSDKALSAVRGRGIAYVFQDPSASLNPVMRIGAQIVEALPPGTTDSAEYVKGLLARVGIPDPIRAFRAYRSEMSGGQQQRVMLAMALAARPQLLVADEPTTALDVTTQQQVLDLIDELAHEFKMAVLLITHNLGLVAGRMQRVNVMYAGSVVESGGVEEVLMRPRHPYTQGLLAAVPRLDTRRGEHLCDIPGTVPSPEALPSGCAFGPRCVYVQEACRMVEPPCQTDGDHTWRCHDSRRVSVNKVNTVNRVP